jgi:hypothetical protein
MNSFPVVENAIPVGWAFRPHQQRRFTIEHGRQESTNLWKGLPPHRHTYFQPAHLLPLVRQPFERSPADVTVYVVCIRDPVAVPQLPPRP